MTEDLRRGDRLGKYELLLRIGRGGMATVWVAREHAERREDDRLVALKVILADLAGDPEFTTMFLDEGRLVETGSHPELLAAGGLYARMWDADRRTLAAAGRGPVEEES